MHRRFFASRLAGAIALVALVAFVPSCGKKGSGGGGGPAVVQPVASTEHILFAHLDAKAILSSPLFREFLDAFANQGERKTFDEIEKEIAQNIGVKFTTVESATIVMPEMSDNERGEPAIIAIVASSARLDKQTIFKGRLKEARDRPGFYEGMGSGLVHFPDDKTLVILHPSLVDRYLSGYARDRNGWPMDANLINKAQGHTAYIAVNPAKLPAEARQDREAERFLPLLEAKSAELTIDLRGKELAVDLRGSFDNSVAAGSAKTALEKLLQEAAEELAKSFKSPRDAEQLGILLPLMKETHRAVAEARVSVSDNVVHASTTFKADFNFGEVVKAAVEKVREAAARTKAQNNLKQIGEAIHNYASANNGDALMIYATGKNGERVRAQFGPKGEPIYDPKPLLSWRVALLPYIEQAPLYQQFKFDEPWDSEHNKKLIDKMPAIYASLTKPGKPGMTHLQQVIGPQCMAPGRFNIGNIPDGTSNTIAVIEAAEPVIWTKPDDVYFPQAQQDMDKPPPADLKKKFGGQYPKGFNVLMFDGSVRYVSENVSDRTLWNLLRPADGNVIGSDW
jgi:prepilin-type processing-associated H-X9-DG protein